MTTIHPRVEHHIRTQQISCTIRRHCDVAADIGSPADFADALGYPLSRITKSVFCRSRSAAAFAVLVGPIDRRIDFKRAAAALDAGRLEVASAHDLQQRTGYPHHGVSPLGLDAEICVVVARELFTFDTVLVGAGAPGVEIEISPADLVDATNAVVENLAQPVCR